MPEDFKSDIDSLGLASSKMMILSHYQKYMFLVMFGKEVGFYYQTLEAIFLLRIFVVCLGSKFFKY